MGCLFLNDLQDSWRAEVELIEQEVIWVDGLQPECAERLAGEVINVGGHDGAWASARMAAATTWQSS